MGVRPYDTFAQLAVYALQRRVELIRTGEVFESVLEIQSFWISVMQWSERLQGDDWDVLTDLSRARGRSDEDFEIAMNKWRAPFYLRFRHSAVVVCTNVGKMQVQRHCRADGPQTSVFDGVAAARAWLLMNRHRSGT